MSAKPQLLTVLGEQVSLEPISFDPSEKFLVSFDTKYNPPELTDSETIALKAIFLKLFSGSGLLSSLVASKSNPLPPCSEEEKALLLKSLTYRFGSLRNELIAERQSQSDSIRLRQITDHLQRLKEYIDFATKSVACDELDESVFAETVGDLTDEQITQLLRQFVFFVLQGQHPLEDFRGRDPNPRGFVARLTKKPITDFDHFLDEYRLKKHPVPLPIEKVLQATKAGVNAMETKLNDRLQDKVNDLVRSLSSLFPEDSPFWTNLDRFNLDAILDRLLEVIQSLQHDIEDCEAQARTDQSLSATLDAERERLDQELRAVQAKLRIAELAQAKLEEDSLMNGSTAELDELRTQLQQRIDALQSQLQRLTDEHDALTQRLEEAETQIERQTQLLAEKETALSKCKQIEETNQKLLKTIGEYQEQLRDAKARIKECEEMETKAKVLEKTLALRDSELVELRKAAGPLTQEIDALLRDKAALQQEQDKLEDELETVTAFVDNLTRLSESLSQEKGIVADLLGSIQRQRASVVPDTDPILQRMNSLRLRLQKEDTYPESLAEDVTRILQDVQAEATEKRLALTAVQTKVQEKDDQITAAKQAMDESTELLQQIRAGRIDSNSKGLKFGTDKEFLEAAVKAVDAEKDLAKQKADLETTLTQLQGKNDALVADMAALQAKLQTELETANESLRASQGELAAEREKTVGLQRTVATQGATLQDLQDNLMRNQEELVAAQQQLEQEREQSASKIASLQETSLRDCEAKLKALRAEEEAKRQTLLGAQGAEKGTLEAKIQELLTKITSVEGERDGVQANLEAEKANLQAIETKLNTLQSTVASQESSLTDLKGQLATKEDEVTSAQRQLEQEREQSASKIASLQESSLRECEEKLNALRQEEEAKRQTLLSAQGAEKGTLEATIQELLTKITGVEGERDAVKADLEVEQANLQAIEEKMKTLQSTVATQGATLQDLKTQLATKEDEVTSSKHQLEQEREQSASNLASLQESSLRECEEKLNALRQQEEAKRQTLLTAQGAEKSTLEQKIQDLLAQITTVEGQRDAVQAKVEVEQANLQAIQETLATLTANHESEKAKLQEQINALTQEKGKAVGESAALTEQVTSLGGEVEDLRRQIMDDTTEKTKVYELVSNISSWIASGATLPIPTIDDGLNRKYGFSRIVESVLKGVPKSKEEKEDPTHSSLSRCYLVFFMTYVYARHFPTKPDGDSSYQSLIAALFKGILKETYTRLGAGIPGKLETVGSGGIPIQLKSKYLMTILLPLLKQMELVHQSGKVGAEFLKFSLLDQDQLQTLHMLHSIVVDKLKQAPKDTLKMMNTYVLRKTGNVDDDILNLYLRFYSESKTKKEYPVIIYTLPDAKELPMTTFGTDIDFSQYLASPAKKPTQTVAPPLQKQLVSNPVFSFSILFYLFLFTVKDYLSSIEGELDKAGCPLPRILTLP